MNITHKSDVIRQCIDDCRVFWNIVSTLRCGPFFPRKMASHPMITSAQLWINRVSCPPDSTSLNIQ